MDASSMSNWQTCIITFIRLLKAIKTMICYIHPYVLSYFSLILPLTSIVSVLHRLIKLITVILQSIEWDPGLISLWSGKS